MYLGHVMISASFVSHELPLNTSVVNQGYQASFLYNGAKTWNTLPRGLRKMNYINSFTFIKAEMDNNVIIPTLTLYLVLTPPPTPT